MQHEEAGSDLQSLWSPSGLLVNSRALLAAFLVACDRANAAVAGGGVG